MHPYKLSPNAMREQRETLLNDGLAELLETDHCAVRLRFFEKRPLKEVRVASGSIKAVGKKRVTRAVDKFRLVFQRRGVAVPTAAALRAGGAVTHLTHT